MRSANLTIKFNDGTSYDTIINTDYLDDIDIHGYLFFGIEDLLF
jgi:hypothetical protein